jgi:hypothetical protein
MLVASAGELSPLAAAARTADSACRTSSTVRNRQVASPGWWNPSAAAIVARREAATDAACGRSGRPAPARSAVGRRDWARVASDWGCRADGPAGCRSFPWRSARVYRARDATRDQDQPIEIPRSRVRKTGDNRKDLADRQLFPTSAGSGNERGQHVGSLYVPFKGRGTSA